MKMIMNIAAWVPKTLSPRTGCRQPVATGAPIALAPIPRKRHGAREWLSCDVASMRTADLPAMLTIHSDDETMSTIRLD